MGGCTNCKGKAGCDDRKGPMMASIDEALVRLYPTRTWGEPDETAWEGKVGFGRYNCSFFTQLSARSNTATLGIAYVAASSGAISSLSHLGSSKSSGLPTSTSCG